MNPPSFSVRDPEEYRLKLFSLEESVKKKLALSELRDSFTTSSAVCRGRLNTRPVCEIGV